MKKKNHKPKKEQPKEEATEWDFSEGFGGIPEEVELTKNIGCASNGGKKKQKKED